MIPTQRVLLVDDSPCDAWQLISVAQRELPEVQFLHAASKEEALRYLRLAGRNTAACSVPSLVVVNLQMRDPPALDLLRWMELREWLALVPRLVVSGSLNAAEKEQARRAGAWAWYEKHADCVEVIRGIRTWLALSWSTLPSPTRIKGPVRRAA